MLLPIQTIIKYTREAINKLEAIREETSILNLKTAEICTQLRRQAISHSDPDLETIIRRNIIYAESLLKAAHLLQDEYNDRSPLPEGIFQEQDMEIEP